MPAKASGPARSELCWTAPTSTPMAMANTAGSAPRSTSTIHHAAASTGSAFGRTLKNFHSCRSRNLRMCPCTIDDGGGAIQRIAARVPRSLLLRHLVSPLGKTASIHHQAARNVDRLASHVGALAGYQKSNNIGHILGLTDSSNRNSRNALLDQLAGLLAEACDAQLTIDLRPHVGIDEARADTVHPNAVGRKRRGQAARHADHRRFADRVHQAGC